MHRFLTIAVLLVALPANGALISSIEVEDWHQAQLEGETIGPWIVLAGANAELERISITNPTFWVTKGPLPHRETISIYDYGRPYTATGPAVLNVRFELLPERTNTDLATISFPNPPSMPSSNVTTWSWPATITSELGTRTLSTQLFAGIPGPEPSSLALAMMLCITVIHLGRTRLA